MTVSEVDTSSPVPVWGPETFDPGCTSYPYDCPPAGWAVDPQPYAWRFRSSMNYLTSLGPSVTAPNAQLYWGYASGATMTSPQINTLGNPTLSLTFAHEVDHWSGSGYSLHVWARGNDDLPWVEIWSISPTANVAEEWVTVDAGVALGPKTQIRFGATGSTVYMDYWYIDNVELTTYGLFPPEYEDQFCVDEIDVCEEMQICFEDWTPATPWPDCGEKTYAICLESRLCDPPDDNIYNNFVCEPITVEFWHDVSIEITKPEGSRAIVWDNGGVDGASYAVASQEAPNYPFLAMTADDFELTASYDINSVTFWGQYWNGVGTEPATFEVHFFADDGTGTAPTGGGSADPRTTALASYSASLTGVPDTSQLKYTMALSPAFPASAGVKYWICAMVVMDFAPQWGFCHNGGNPDQGATAVQGFPVLGLPFWSDPAVGDMAFYLEGDVGGPSVPTPEVYIPCGPQDLCVDVENLGTFAEIGCDVNWQLLEYYSNPPNPTYVDGGTVVVDLDPGEVEEVCFGSYDFPEPGVYLLEVEIVTPGMDCYMDNNEDSLAIGVDCCPPESEHELDPATPDGENNWYVSDVEVTITAEDVLCPDPCEDGIETGISEIIYTINGVEYSIPGASGSFILDDDGNNLVTYYAIDGVGNEEVAHTFTVAIDQTPPTCDLAHTEYETATGWAVDFEAIAADVTSGMNRVEFKRGSELLETVTAPPFEYTHTWESGDGSATFYAYAYDQAGNSASDSASIQLSLNLVLQQGKVVSVNKVLQRLI
jgi:hypothetical protein